MTKRKAEVSETVSGKWTVTPGEQSISVDRSDPPSCSSRVPSKRTRACRVHIRSVEDSIIKIRRKRMRKPTVLNMVPISDGIAKHNSASPSQSTPKLDLHNIAECTTKDCSSGVPCKRARACRVNIRSVEDSIIKVRRKRMRKPTVPNMVPISDGIAKHNSASPSQSTSKLDLHNIAECTMKDMSFPPSGEKESPPLTNLSQPPTSESSDSEDVKEATTLLHIISNIGKRNTTDSPEHRKEHGDCLLMLAQVAENPALSSTPLSFSCIYTRRPAEDKPTMQLVERDNKLTQTCPRLANSSQPSTSTLDSADAKEDTMEFDEQMVTKRAVTSIDRGCPPNCTSSEMEESDDDSSSQDKVDGPSLTTVAGCELEKEFAHAAQIIISKHGDILANCLLQGSLRSHLLRSASSIYMKLKRLNFAVLTLADVDSMQRDVRDLERAKVEISWLSKRVDDIHIAKQLEECNPLSLMEQQLKENQKNIKGLLKKLRLQKAKFERIKSKLETEKAQSAAIHETILEVEGLVSPFVGRSLIDGI